MDENLMFINDLLNDLEESIGILIEALKEKESVSLMNNDTFKSIISNITVLERYNNKSLKELFAYYRATLSHLSKAFNNKDFVNRDDVNSILICLNDIKVLKSKMDMYINQPFYKYLENLKRISREFKDSYSDFIGFLLDGQIDNQFLIEYENIINKLLNTIDDSDIIKNDMNDDDFEKFKLELKNVYKGFRANLNDFYTGIKNSNIGEIARPLLGQVITDFNNENYVAIRDNSLIHKEITDKDYRNVIIKNLDTLIKSLESIIERYKMCRVNKGNNAEVDVIGDSININEIDIPHFIEDNYEEHRSSSSKENNVNYDKKVAAFITRFAILKRKLERKKSLTKEEVKLYNKLESELDALKRGKSTGFISGIKFNHYYKLLNKKMKVSRKNDFNNITQGNKKRK